MRAGAGEGGEGAKVFSVENIELNAATNNWENVRKAYLLKS